MKRFLYFLIVLFLISCSNSKNSLEFIIATSGNYLFNSEESIGVSFVENEMIVNWRGNDNIKPLKVNDSTFYIKEMNEKFIFITKPKTHIKLAEKREHKGQEIRFIKMKKDQKTPKEYFTNKEYDKALEGYLSIRENNPSSRSVNESDLNYLGCRALKDKNYEKAMHIFKINTILYPKNANTFDSLGDAYWKLKDTVKALDCFNKVLTLDSENKRAKQFLKDFTFE